MESDSSRSKQVIDHFIKRKLAFNALQKIQALIQGWEKDREIDTRIALIGVAAILLIMVTAVLYYLSSDRVTIF